MPLDTSKLPEDLTRILKQELDVLEMRTDQELTLMVNALSKRQAFRLYCDHMKLGDHADSLIAVAVCLDRAYTPEVPNGKA